MSDIVIEDKFQEVLNRIKKTKKERKPTELTEEGKLKKKEGIKKWAEFVRAINHHRIMEDFKGPGKRGVQSLLFKLSKKEDIPEDHAIDILDGIQSEVQKLIQSGINQKEAMMRTIKLLE